MEEQDVIRIIAENVVNISQQRDWLIISLDFIGFIISGFVSALAGAIVGIYIYRKQVKRDDNNNRQLTITEIIGPLIRDIDILTSGAHFQQDRLTIVPLGERPKDEWSLQFIPYIRQQRLQHLKPEEIETANELLTIYNEVELAIPKAYSDINEEWKGKKPKEEPNWPDIANTYIRTRWLEMKIKTPTNEEFIKSNPKMAEHVTTSPHSIKVGELINQLESKYKNLKGSIDQKQNT